METFKNKAIEELVERICEDDGKELVMFECVFDYCYAAIKRNNNIYAVVIKFELINNDYKFSFWHENDLPNHHDASLELLSILSPTNNKNANIWRKRTAIK